MSAGGLRGTEGRYPRNCPRGPHHGGEEGARALPHVQPCCARGGCLQGSDPVSHRCALPVGVGSSLQGHRHSSRGGGRQRMAC
jgi:hypothetical protein